MKYEYTEVEEGSRQYDDVDFSHGAPVKAVYVKSNVGYDNGKRQQLWGLQELRAMRGMPSEGEMHEDLQKGIQGVPGIYGALGPEEKGQRPT